MKAKLIVAGILAFFSSIALAGFTQPQSVVVDLDNGTAFGDMYTARTSANDVEFIGCGIRVFDDGAGGTFSFGFCQAGDSEGTEITCFTQNSGLLDTLRTMADFSFVTFSWVDDGAGNIDCSRIGFSTQSFYVPNFTTKGTN